MPYNYKLQGRYLLLLCPYFGILRGLLECIKNNLRNVFR